MPCQGAHLNQSSNNYFATLSATMERVLLLFGLVALAASYVVSIYLLVIFRERDAHSNCVP